MRELFGGGRAIALGRALCVLLFLGAGCAWAQVPVPSLEARVTDLTGTLTAGQQAALEDKLSAFESRKGSQVVVLLVPTTEPEDIAQFGIRVFDQWKLGRGKVNGRSVDDGALFIVAKNDRRMRIEVGRGLEGALTDATSKRIISETITPLFRQGDFYGGINAGVEQMMRVIDGEPLPPPDQKWRGDPPAVVGMLPFLFFGTLVLASILNRIFGRGIGAIATGGIAGGVVWLIAKLLGLALVAGFIAALFALFTGIPRRGWSSSSRHAGWGGGWGGLGGGGFGGGGFGGGGGGFSGGGGGAAGGGASGSW
jgi:uncharacterized protein